MGREQRPTGQVREEREEREKRKEAETRRKFTIFCCILMTHTLQRTLCQNSPTAIPNTTLLFDYRNAVTRILMALYNVIDNQEPCNVVLYVSECGDIEFCFLQ